MWLDAYCSRILATARAAGSVSGRSSPAIMPESLLSRLDGALPVALESQAEQVAGGVGEDPEPFAITSRPKRDPVWGPVGRSPNRSALCRTRRPARYPARRMRPVQDGLLKSCPSACPCRPTKSDGYRNAVPIRTMSQPQIRPSATRPPIRPIRGRSGWRCRCGMLRRNWREWR